MKKQTPQKKFYELFQRRETYKKISNQIRVISHLYGTPWHIHELSKCTLQMDLLSNALQESFSAPHVRKIAKVYYTQQRCAQVSQKWKKDESFGTVKRVLSVQHSYQN